ncbi:hypothetical protein B8W88_13580 [Lactococcus lactis]|uniref:Phage protein n=2 Tax=Lactococcus lactis TaxID=1358 RepID=A0AAX0PZS0_9LACT|nr:hypothetical protein B8W88_13580 [Lactococcus lactis]TLQ13950.1 hypothetical protein FEZ45_13135 [Lactococcus lactis subsp. lactis]PAL02018.1 hypothetical protein B8W91_14120 [Lactococcus lactis]RQE34972.1 hypothetical protein D6122_13060 [Lactococcus lactis]RQE43859.1 hypothetical protein D6124_11215 [Lactococcus lactis]
MKGAAMSEEIQGWRDIIQQNGKRVQPQLTIPKSIADEIDKFAHTNWANWQFYFYSDEMSKELIDWFDNGDSEFTNSKIAMVYLNPLTRDLVKVGEGIDDNY